MREYLKLCMLQGSLIPESESLTEEEKQEKELRRIINGEDEQQGLPIYTFGDFTEHDLYVPVDLIDTFFGVEQGSSISLGDGGAYLVKETPDEIFSLPESGGTVKLINR